MRYLWYNHKKISLIGLAILVVGFLGFFSIHYSLNHTNMALATRDTSEPNLTGWVWADTIGWISLNCLDAGTCGTTDYGVYYNSTTGFEGYAWSDNVGWIDFTNATYNSGTHKIEGTATWTALGSSDGEIRFTNSVPAFDLDFIQSADITTLRSSGFTRASVVAGNYSQWGNLQGWAWNGGDSINKKGLGWVSFNCDDGNSTNTCSTVNYKATGKPTNISISVIRTPDNEDDSLTVQWNSNILGVEWLDIWSRISDVPSPPPNPSDSFSHKNTINTTSTTQYIDSNLGWYYEYEYLVMACNVFGCNLSNMATKRTSPFRFDDSADLKVSGVCQDDTNASTSYVDLDWGAAAVSSLWSGTPDHYDVEYCVLEQGESINDCDNWLNITASDSGCLDYDGGARRQCRDVLAGARYNDRYNLHAYRVRLVAAQKICQLDSNTSCSVDADCTALSLGTCIEETSGWLESGRLVRPCPKRTQPDYVEVRPES